MLLVRLAFRNLFEHRSKSLIIGGILALGVFFLVTGNSFMDTVSRGLEKAYTQGFTGHLAVTGPAPGGLPLFQGGFEEGPLIIPDYERVLTLVRATPGVEAVSPQVTGFGRYLVDDRLVGTGLLLGIDPVLYRQMFPHNLTVVSGAFLGPGEEGILLSELTVKTMEEEGLVVGPGTKILVNSPNVVTGNKVREVTVRGVVRFESSNEVLARLSLIDINSLRALTGLVVGAAASNDGSSGGVSPPLGNPDDLFGVEDDLVSESPTSGVVGDFYNLLGDTSERKRLSVADSGAWTHLLIRLKDPSDLNTVRQVLQASLDAHDSDARVQDWVTGAGVFAEASLVLKAVFHFLVSMVAFVALVIITNTLVISVTERVPEIGTMRALGAQKSFIRTLILWETALTSGIFGVLGVVLAALTLGALNAVGLAAPNEFFAVILGGRVFHPELSFAAVFQSLGVVVAVGVLASLYPTALALRVQPVKAMQSE